MLDARKALEILWVVLVERGDVNRKRPGHGSRRFELLREILRTPIGARVEGGGHANFVGAADHGKGNERQDDTGNDNSRNAYTYTCTTTHIL